MEEVRLDRLHRIMGLQVKPGILQRHLQRSLLEGVSECAGLRDLSQAGQRLARVDPREPVHAHAYPCTNGTAGCGVWGVGCGV